MRAKLILILSCSFLLATIVLVAQDIPPDELYWVSRPYVPEIAATPIIRLQSDLVEVATVVRDSHENPVGNLQKSDFLLFDNGKPQTISTFSVQTGPQNSATATANAAPGAEPATVTSAAPVQSRYVALFFDDVNTSIPNLYFAREGAIKFIKKGLDPGERVGIFTASGILNLDFTDNVQKLLDALPKLSLLQRMPDQGVLACPPMTTYQAWVIVHVGGNTDELLAAAAAAGQCCGPHPISCVQSAAEDRVSVAEESSLGTLHSMSYVIRRLGQMPGRRILVLTSSGFLTLSFRQETQRVIEDALRAGVVINSLDSEGLNPNRDRFGSHFNMSLPMSDMALGTGGKFIHNSNDMGGGMRSLSSVPSVSYVLGFSPENLKVDGKMHNLKVKLTEPAHLTVEARPAYYAPSPELSPAEKRFRKLEQSVTAADNRAEIPIEFTVVPETLTTGGTSLKVVVHVDVRKLPFQQMTWSGIGQRQVERLIFITALFDAQNHFLTGVQGVMDLRLKEATLKQLSAQGLDAKLSLQAPAGSYRVRQVVQESVSGRIAAVSRPVEIH